MANARATLRPAHGLALALGMIAGAVAVQSLAVLGAIAALGLGATLVANVSIHHALARLRATLLVVAAVIALRVFLATGHPLLEGCVLAARVSACALWASWFAAAHTPLQIDEGLCDFGAPRSLVALLGLTRRFGAQLVATMRSAWHASALRGGFGSARTTAATVGTIAGLLTARSFDRAFRAQLALDLRGGDGALVARGGPISWASWLALAAVAGVAALADRAWGTP